jgi:sigma-B regulation protein RsbU (phosphoserine phosphatase)
MTDTEDLKSKRNLNALVEFSRILNSSMDLEFILSNVLLTCMGKFLSTKGFIALKVDESLTIRSSKGFSKNYLETFPKISTGKDFFKEKEFKDFIKGGNICAVEKINSSNDCLGIICLGEKLNKTAYSEDDLEFLRTILNISATAVQNSIVLTELTRVNRFLDSRIHRLGSLFELSKEFGLFTESSKVAKLLIYSVIGQFLVSKFAVIIFEGSGIQVLESKFPSDQLIRLTDKVRQIGIENFLNKGEIKEHLPEFSDLQIELIVPMQMQGQTKGLILLGKRINDQEYSPEDIEFIFSVGSLSIVSIENRRLFKEALEKQRMEEELEIARDIQKNLLPRKLPKYSSFDIAALNLSSRQVGGDYYDIIPLGDDNFCVAIADVSGKGVPAALLMANLQAFLKIICKHGMQLDEATALINDLITENTSDGKFITFFWGLLDNESKALNYINAGHNPPLLIRNGKIRKLETGGIILGVLKTFTPYESESIALQKDDVLILFTDGITEAKNTSDDEFSDEKLEELSLLFAEKSAEEIVFAIRREVQNFSVGAIQSDDITLLVIKVK